MSSTFNVDPPIDSEKQEGWESFKAAFKSHRMFVFGGLVSGLSLIIAESGFGLKEALGWRHVLGLAMEHLGLGLIVSSIAVFGYEWRSNVKKVVVLARELEQSLKDVNLIRESLQRSGTLLELLTKKGAEALDPSLRAFIGENNHSLCGGLKELVQAISDIEKATAESGIEKGTQDQYTPLVKQGYVSVTEGLLRRVVLKNALEFQKVVGGGEGHFNVPATSGGMADKILAKQMSLMAEGDSYDVVSDIGSWRDNLLEEFSKESLNKIRSGKVKVRRVFNLFRPGLPPINSPGYREACERTIRTLLIHAKASLEWPMKSKSGYEVKIFWDTELIEADRLYPTFWDNEFRQAHFGLFIHRQPRKVIRFRVQVEDLSNMMLNWDSLETQRDEDLFKAMWRVSQPLSEETVQVIQKRLLEGLHL